MSPLTTNEFTVKNYFDFAEEVVNYDNHIYIVCLDNESLFTSIHLKKLLITVSAIYSPIIFYSGKISRKDLYDLLKVATTESSFIFDNKLYKQIDEVAMGSPVGLTLAANSFLCLYDKIWLNEHASQFKPVV